MDSIRAFQWFKMTKDSAYILKYLSFSNQHRKDKPSPKPVEKKRNTLALLQEKKYLVKKRTTG
jgi:hypothetical protein